MILSLLLVPIAYLTIASACADHTYPRRTVKRASESRDIAWDYDTTQDWGRLSPEFATRQHGTMQAPIPLFTSQGMSMAHIPNFGGYDRSVNGIFDNWGFKPSMTLIHPEGVFTDLPSFSFEDKGKNETVHLIGWHIHAPSDHTVDGKRTRAEMHMVHVTLLGTPRAVLSLRIEPGTIGSEWFASMPAPISYRVNTTMEGSINPMQAVREVANFSEFWTYQGSLTTPPCSEGLRFFVSRQIMYTDVTQMQHILDASKYSARHEQQVWEHRINL